MSLKCFFYAVHSRIYGYELLPSIQPSSRTKRMFGIHTCLSNVFFYALHSRMYGYELLPSIQPSSWTKLMFGIHKCLSDVFFFMLYTHEFMGMSCCRQFNLLLGRNSCLGYINVSQMFFFMLYTHGFMGMSCCRPWSAREK